jgi:hypothetical protein
MYSRCVNSSAIISLLRSSEILWTAGLYTFGPYGTVQARDLLFGYQTQHTRFFSMRPRFFSSVSEAASLVVGA